MSFDERELLQRLRETFRAEAREHVQNIAAGLIALERAAPQDAAGVLDAVFRAAHSLKGAARAVDIEPIESLCQALENVFAALRRRSVAPSAELFDALHRGADTLSQLLAAMESSAPAPSPASIATLRRRLHAALAPAGAPAAPAALATAATPATPAARAAPAPTAPAPASAPADAPDAPDAPAPAAPGGGESRLLPASGDSVRVLKRRLDTVLLRSEELLHVKLATTQRASALGALAQRSTGWRARWSRLRADLPAIEAALARRADAQPGVLEAWARVRAYLDDTHDFTATLEGELMELAHETGQDRRVSAAMIDQLLDEMKQIVVQPFSTVLDLFPPSVRELARDQGKEIELVIAGGETEIDRRILDDVKDPLIHVVRNSVDHGIELPAVRRARGKPERGRIAITVSQRDGHQVEIAVRDDGAGFDADALQRAAAKAGTVTAGSRGTALSRDARLALAFEPGVSTRPLVTELSGRGLGLSIVKERVERLAGTLHLESTPGEGASLHITLPLTFTRFRGVVVRAAGHCLVLPTRSVARVARVAAEQVRTVENRASIVLEDRAIALVALADVLGFQGADERSAGGPVVVLGGGALGEPVAFGVDEVVDEREVLVKPLGRPLARVRHVAAATVLGDGRVAPILHVPDLLRTAAAHAGPAPGARERDDAPAPPRKRVLVVEDSVTSRALVRGILESAGYEVQTAADGLEAFTTLRSHPFDLVVSDVDMPRLNGFGLTAKIRADRSLADLPVVLVTALDSREDREHGIDVGADAYLVKSRFDQGNLLEVVRGLA